MASTRTTPPRGVGLSRKIRRRGGVLRGRGGDGDARVELLNADPVLTNLAPLAVHHDRGHVTARAVALPLVPRVRRRECAQRTNDAAPELLDLCMVHVACNPVTVRRLAPVLR